MYMYIYIYIYMYVPYIHIHNISVVSIVTWPFHDKTNLLQEAVIKPVTSRAGVTSNLDVARLYDGHKWVFYDLWCTM